MFTGIIETTGIIASSEANGSNRVLWISSPISHELKIDQSVSHDGVCLTVDAIAEGMHRVTAIAETLDKTTMRNWKTGDPVNLERCMMANGRLDGHIVQGHVDCKATCVSKMSREGSWEYRFRIPDTFSNLIIEKGSISLNGISLTIFGISRNEFTVAIIPYTYSFTTMGRLEPEALVNIEFDMIGKYINRISQNALQPTE